MWVLDRQQEEALLSIVLDGLDDLFDRVPRAEVWLVRLLIAAGAALRGSIWETQLVDVAAEVRALLGSGLTGTDLNDAALTATDDLRLAIASDF